MERMLCELLLLSYQPSHLTFGLGWGGTLWDSTPQHHSLTLYAANKKENILHRGVMLVMKMTKSTYLGI